jgi:hypothetical protein
MKRPMILDAAGIRAHSASTLLARSTGAVIGCMPGESFEADPGATPAQAGQRGCE